MIRDQVHFIFSLVPAPRLHTPSPFPLPLYLPVVYRRRGARAHAARASAADRRERFAVRADEKCRSTRTHSSARSAGSTAARSGPRATTSRRPSASACRRRGGGQGPGRRDYRGRGPLTDFPHLPPTFSLFICTCSTKRTWLPNAQVKSLFSTLLGASIKVGVTTHVLRRMDRVGGLDEYILRAKPGELKSEFGEALRRKLLTVQDSERRWKERQAVRAAVEARAAVGKGAAAEELR
jgi:ribosomal protein L28